jgi:hypothetical protein
VSHPLPQNSSRGPASGKGENANSRHSALYAMDAHSFHSMPRSPSILNKHYDPHHSIGSPRVPSFNQAQTILSPIVTNPMLQPTSSQSDPQPVQHPHISVGPKFKGSIMYTQAHFYGVAPNSITSPQPTQNPAQSTFGSIAGHQLMKTETFGIVSCEN